MTPTEIVTEQFKAAGLTAQYKRRCKDGTLADATEKELQVLKTQSQIATVAQQLQHVTKEERTVWAVEMKDYANELYSQGLVAEAMSKYAEALAASDFSEDRGNVDVLVMPVLCNLAACCIQIEEFGKGVRFCNQAIELRPECGKAHMRKGICFFHLGEFDRSVASLHRALEIINIAIPATPVPAVAAGSPSSSRRRSVEGSAGEEDESSPSDDVLSSARKERSQDEVDYKSIEKRRILLFISKAQKGLDKQTVNEVKQKKALQKVFSSGQVLGDVKKRGRPKAQVAATPLPSSPPYPLSEGKGPGILGSVYLFLLSVLRFLLSLLSHRLQKTFGPRDA